MDKQTQKQLLNIVKKSYEENAEKFSETRKRNLSQLWGELLKLTENIKPQSKVLDVGCGNGRLLRAIGKKKIDYLGVDANEKLVTLAQELYPERRFLQGDLLTLSSFPEINFDYVFLIAVLHHLPGADLRIAALKQLRNKVSDQGKIVISVWNMWPQSKFRKLIWKFAFLKLLKKNNYDFGDILFFGWRDDKGGGGQRYYHAFTMRELKKLIKKAGLKIEETFKDKYNYYLILKK